MACSLPMSTVLALRSPLQSMATASSSAAIYEDDSSVTSFGAPEASIKASRWRASNGGFWESAQFNVAPFAGCVGRLNPRCIQTLRKPARLPGRLPVKAHGHEASELTASRMLVRIPNVFRNHSLPFYPLSLFNPPSTLRFFFLSSSLSSLISYLFLLISHLWPVLHSYG
jgi:hypothetical protein